jgi:16S rRNA (cytidine1402-2'-O)-methyltransferase
MATLYVVSTPIGNLEDITHRAVRVLGEADRVLAEDTRRTGVLLQRFAIRTPLVSLHAHNEAARSEKVLEWLDRGETLALVSDAGTPLVSDPGERLVRDVVAAGHAVVPIPGPSALLAALVGSGLGAAGFTFLGFLPRSGKARAEALARIARSELVTVVYESPNRLVRLLEDVVGACGAQRPVSVARELTKVHESFVRGSAAQVLAHYQAQASVRGEVVVVIGAAPEGGGPADDIDPDDVARELLAAGLSASEAARELARRLQLRRNQAYQIVQSLGAAEDS